jgi:hypothetical protein
MPKIINVNCSTGEQIIVEATGEKLLQIEKDQQEFLRTQSQAAAKEAARQALLDKLGITADEAKLLLG